MAKEKGSRLIANNKKAYFDYFIEDTYDSRGNKNIVSREENSISDVLFYFDGEDNVKSIILDDRMFNEAEFLYQILEKNLNNEKNKQLCKDLQ